eukprot:TRINITY_DN90489_c0_g1_i1.p1 TRINITY_DN90489_c0_g1~~TRINITY_DN90489_c0_g1_i1.p1  ORF type:complete len:212 (+),score=35.22 TRINITY_DN90489_c0_g1_i1:2-637(+)
MFLRTPVSNLLDFFAKLGAPGPEREKKAFLIFKQLLKSILDLHALGLAHGAITADNTWIREISKSRPGVPGHPEDDYEVVLTGISASSPTWSADKIPNKDEDSMYLPPEARESHEAKDFDVRAADLFACGVLGYALATGLRPWYSTKPGSCKAFGFAKSHGPDNFLKEAKCPASRLPSCMSPEYRELLCSLLQMDPQKRLGATRLIAASNL